MMFLARPKVGSPPAVAPRAWAANSVGSDSPSRFSPPIRISSRREMRSHSV